MSLFFDADIDIDVKDRESVLQYINWTKATVNPEEGEIHPVGVYWEKIPQFSGYSSLSYEEAAAMGWTKIDILNVHIYDHVKSNSHKWELLQRDISWYKLQLDEVLDGTFQLSSQLAKMVCKMYKPQCLEDLAVIIALMRPGKKHLIGENMERILEEIWKPTEEFYFKKAHSISYAFAIKLHIAIREEIGEI